MSTLSTLSARLLLAQVSISVSQVTAALQATKRSLYLGIDPTASSLHVGHLLPIMAACHFMRDGHSVQPLIGSATATIGDPTGRTLQRNSLDATTLDQNAQSISIQVSRLLERGGLSPCRPVLNNQSWFQPLGLLDFLAEVGGLKVTQMLARESVAQRKEGLGFAELTYQLLQAYDFYHLFKYHGCSIQLGGNDQWGNITAGLDLISRLMPQSEVYGITTPLLLQSDGQKFGKSLPVSSFGAGGAGGMVWLDAKKTPVYDFYQYFLNQADQDLPGLLKRLTFLPLKEVDQVVKEHQNSPEKRLGQAILAKQVTALVHGDEALERAQLATRLLFNSELLFSSSKEELIKAFEHHPYTVKMERAELVGLLLDKLALPLFSSKSISNTAIIADCGVGADEMTRVASDGGLLLNNQPIVKPFKRVISPEDFINEEFLLIRVGKKCQIIWTGQFN